MNSEFQAGGSSLTYRELYLLTKKKLSEAGVDSPGDDSLLLLEHFFSLDRTGLALRGEDCPDAAREAEFLRAVGERAGRRPLQYILGHWEFMGLSLAVGEGVLCPREDTAVLAEAAAERLGARHASGPPVGLDLCAGTGAAALGLCSLLPEAQVTCLELSEEAFPYLEQNLAAYPQFAVRAERGDILSPETAARYAAGSVDFIVSNPPYVRSRVIPSLQPEVQKEPALALDGGEDGLVFYRGIVRLWAEKLKKGGVLAVEIGEDQGPAVTELFAAAGLGDLEIKQDLSGLDRCVLGSK